MREFTEIFRHQQPHVAEMAMEKLKKKGIPCFMQEGSVTGLEVSPVCPAVAPGVEYVVYVHRSILDQAKLIVGELPVDEQLLTVSWTEGLNRKRRVYLALLMVLGVIFLIILTILCFLPFHFL